jgi:hypothetical protein
VFYTGSLASFSVPKLERATRIEFYSSGPTSLSFPALVRVDELSVSFMRRLTSLSLGALVTAEGFRVFENSDLVTLTAPALRTVEVFEIDFNGMLSQCTALRLLTALSRPPSSQAVQGNDATMACALNDVCRRTTVPGITPAIWSCLEPVSFADARTRCSTASTGAGLLWLESDAEWTALSAAARGGQVGPGWLGYSDEAMDGTWVNFAMSTYDPTLRMDFWALGEPGGGLLEGGAELLPSGRVNDLDGTLLRPFLCRVP